MDAEIKILCVDDEPNVLNALRRLFLDNDYKIFTAASGREGLDILAREHAQIIISDYRMPGMDGVEFLREVCSRNPETVRIVLSGYADAAAIVSAINEGQIYKFVPKPWNDDELKVTVANAIERYFLYIRNKELTAELREKNEALTRLNSELERLLEEESAHLAFRGRVLTSHQNMLDSLPVAILGVDLNNTVVLHNAAWVALAGDDWYALGQSLDDSMPRDIIDFIGEVRNTQKGALKLEINGRHGRLLGTFMDYRHDQKGVILTFICEEGIPC